MKNGRTKNESSGNCAAENEKANAAKENMGAFCKKPLGKQLRGQFFYKNIPIFCLAVFAALAAGSLNLILSWIIQQLMDTAAGESGALSFRTLLLISAGFVLLCAGLSLLNYASQPRFLERAMRQYKDFAFKKLIGKSISSFRDESAAGYLSALTNDAASIETNYLAQMLAMITKAVTFIGALLLMCRYSLLMTAIAAGLTVLNRLKTGVMISAAAELGCIASEMPATMRAQALVYADAIGRGFQIRDDMLDVEGDQAVFGKPIGSDVQEGKVTFVDVIGMDACRQEVAACTETAKAAVAGWPDHGFLWELADRMVGRRK